MGIKKNGGLWSLEEQAFHINHLELKAVLSGLKSLCSTIRNKHIRIHEYESDLRSNEHYLSSSEKKACTGFEPVTSAIPVQCSTN